VTKPGPAEFTWRQFKPQVILMGVGWYLRFSLSYRDVEELVRERGLSVPRDAAAAKRFFQKALRSPNHPTPQVINADKNPSYPPVVEELKREGTLRRRCQLRSVQYFNNIVEQDHRAIKRRARASQGFRSFWGATGDPRIRSNARDSNGASETSRDRSGRAPPGFHRRTVPDCEVMQCRTEPFPYLLFQSCNTAGGIEWKG
jgi:hypothetical protein